MPNSLQGLVNYQSGKTSRIELSERQIAEVKHAASNEVPVLEEPVAIRTPTIPS